MVIFWNESTVMMYVANKCDLWRVQHFKIKQLLFKQWTLEYPNKSVCYKTANDVAQCASFQIPSTQ